MLAGRQCASPRATVSSVLTAALPCRLQLTADGRSWQRHWQKILLWGRREVTRLAPCKAGRAGGLRGTWAATQGLLFAIHWGLLLAPWRQSFWTVVFGVNFWRAVRHLSRACLEQETAAGHWYAVSSQISPKTWRCYVCCYSAMIFCSRKCGQS